ncbi:MAG: UDP-3-O-(3-hydroxymyristoyl)glucosamine N-acyltransferase [Alphaproteobacteria bacterium]|nr:UDP-3-O-(3-hydroxymyristoyl)glucosamine N-acyltransferase [Alphaproteobacteria bacterium]
MADKRFFTVAGPFTAEEIAGRTGATLAGSGNGKLALRDVAPLDAARPDQLSFLDNRKYIDLFRKTGAGACFVHPDLASEAPKGVALLVTPEPYRAYALAAQAFYPEPPPVPGIAPSAVVDATVELGEGCRIEANAVIGDHAKLGRRCLVGPNAVIGAGVVLGDDVRVGSCASISHSLIGNRVRIYPGARLGQDGFGFAPDRNGFVKVPQLGRVIVGDDVEIGANSTVDRGAGPDTVIGPGTMIDNLVQIGHNVQIGRQCVLVSQTGISGSTKLGDFVMIGGQGGLTGHLNIGSGAKIGAQAGVMRDVPAGETVIGAPAIPAREFFRQVAALQRLAKKRDD